MIFSYLNKEGGDEGIVHVNQVSYRIVINTRFDSLVVGCLEGQVEEGGARTTVVLRLAVERLVADTGGLRLVLLLVLRDRDWLLKELILLGKRTAKRCIGLWGAIAERRRRLE